MSASSAEMLQSLPPLNTEKRADALRAAVSAADEEANGGNSNPADAAQQPEALLLTNLANIRWLTGFSGSAALVVLTQDDLLLLTDGRYASQAPAEFEAAGTLGRIEIGYSRDEQRKAATAALRQVRSIGLEAGSITWQQVRTFAEEWFTEAELVPTKGLVEELRRRKSHAEVARITAAAAIADEALAETLPLLAEEPTEADFACELDYRMRRLGASESAFETIVAAGEHSALPHARPGTRRIRHGELVVLDFGATVDGYRSDMTRTVYSENLRAPERDLFDLVLEAQAAGLEAVATGVPCSTVDAAARGVIEEAGLGEAFMHSTGHGVGLDIHERPTISSLSVEVLAEADVVTVEPGVYIQGRGGVRIEDTVLVSADGYRQLTNSPKS